MATLLVGLLQHLKPNAHAQVAMIGKITIVSNLLALLHNTPSMEFVKTALLKMPCLIQRNHLQETASYAIASRTTISFLLAMPMPAHAIIALDCLISEIR